MGELSDNCSWGSFGCLLKYHGLGLASSTSVEHFMKRLAPDVSHLSDLNFVLFKLALCFYITSISLTLLILEIFALFSKNIINVVKK